MSSRPEVLADVSPILRVSHFVRELRGGPGQRLELAVLLEAGTGTPYIVPFGRADPHGRPAYFVTSN
jgi:hypothetical protein